MPIKILNIKNNKNMNNNFIIKIKNKVCNNTTNILENLLNSLGLVMY